MREDYLWDKSGEDAEIRRLENALKVFRSKQTAPPALPTKILIPEEKTPRRIFGFRFALALASSAAAVLVLLGVWFQFANNKTLNAGEIAGAKSDESADRISRIEPPTAPPTLPVKAKPPTPTAERNIVKINRTIPARQNKKPVGKTQARRQELALTEEEKYAYDQLMLALSITSSKLKIVRDKANGIEDQTVSFEKLR